MHMHGEGYSTWYECLLPQLLPLCIKRLLKAMLILFLPPSLFLSEVMVALREVRLNGEQRIFFYEGDTRFDDRLMLPVTLNPSGVVVARVHVLVSGDMSHTYILDVSIAQCTSSVAAQRYKLCCGEKSVSLSQYSTTDIHSISLVYGTVHLHGSQEENGVTMSVGK